MHFIEAKSILSARNGMNLYRGCQHGCMSPDNAALMALFHARCEKAGIMHDNDAIFRYLNEFENKNTQLSLF